MKAIPLIYINVISNVIIFTSVALLPTVLSFLHLYLNADISTMSRTILYSVGLPIIAIEVLVILHAIAARKLTLHSFAQIPLWAATLMVIFLFVAFGTAEFTAVKSGMAYFYTVLWCIHMLYGFTLFQLVREGACSNKQYIASSLIISMGLYVVILAFYLSVLGKNPDIAWRHSMIGFANVRHMNIIAAAALASLIGIIACSSGKPRKYLLLITTLATIFWALLFWSGARGGILALIVTIAISFILMPIQNKKQTLLTILATCIGGAALSLIYQVPSPSFSILRFWHRTTPLSDMNKMSAGRLEMWIKTLDLIKDNPTFGHGIRQFNVVGTDFSAYGAASPHNSILQFAFDWGVVGLVCLSIIIFKLWASTVVITSNNTTANLPLFMPLTMMIVLSFTDTVFYHPYPLMLMATLTAVILGNKTKVNEGQ